MRIFEFFRPLSNLHSETSRKATNFDNYRRREAARFMKPPFPAIFADGFGGKGDYLYQNRRIGNEILQDNPHTRRICRRHRNRKRRRYAADGGIRQRAESGILPFTDFRRIRPAAFCRLRTFEGFDPRHFAVCRLSQDSVRGILPFTDFWNCKRDFTLNFGKSALSLFPGFCLGKKNNSIWRFS